MLVWDEDLVLGCDFEGVVLVVVVVVLERSVVSLALKIETFDLLLGREGE